MSSVLGIILEFTSAPNTTLSEAASPKVSVPPLNVVVPVTVRLPSTSTLPANVALAPLAVSIVVEPDLIIKLPEVLVSAAY